MGFWVPYPFNSVHNYSFQFPQEGLIPFQNSTYPQRHCLFGVMMTLSEKISKISNGIFRCCDFSARLIASRFVYIDTPSISKGVGGYMI